MIYAFVIKLRTAQPSLVLDIDYRVSVGHYYNFSKLRRGFIVTDFLFDLYLFFSNLQIFKHTFKSRFYNSGNSTPLLLSSSQLGCYLIYLMINMIYFVLKLCTTTVYYNQIIYTDFVGFYFLKY